MKTSNPAYQNKPMNSAQGNFPLTEECIRFATIGDVKVCFMNWRYTWMRNETTKHGMYVDNDTEQWYIFYPMQGTTWDDHVMDRLPIPYFDHEKEESIFQFSTLYDIPIDIITELQKMHDWKA